MLNSCGWIAGQNMSGTHEQHEAGDITCSGLPQPRYPDDLQTGSDVSGHSCPACKQKPSGSSRHLLLLPPSPQNRTLWTLCSPQGLPEDMGQHLEVSLSTLRKCKTQPKATVPRKPLPSSATLPPCPGCWDMHTLVRYTATGSMRPGSCGSATTQLSSRFRRVLAGRLSSALASAAGPRAL